MRKLIGRMAVSIMLFMAQAASAGPFEDGQAAYNRGDYATALKLMRPLAAQGDARAQSSLGVMYENGRGVAQDYEEAVKWFRLAAPQGDARAQFNLGVMYANGQGVAQDYARAHMWFNLGASLLTGEAGKIASTNRDNVAQKMTQQQIAEAQTMARKCQQSNFKNCGEP